jgi:hypothetical protein
MSFMKQFHILKCKKGILEVSVTFNFTAVCVMMILFTHNREYVFSFFTFAALYTVQIC